VFGTDGSASTSSILSIVSILSILGAFVGVYLVNKKIQEKNTKQGCYLKVSEPNAEVMIKV